MKKPNQKAILRQKKSDLKTRKESTRRSHTYIGLIKFSSVISLAKIGHREKFLETIRKIKLRDRANKSLYLNFKDVELLLPEGVIYLLHQLDKLKNKKELLGRTSDKDVVKAMFSRLGIHSLIKQPPYVGKTINIVDRWECLSGDSADLGAEYEKIEEQIALILPDRRARFVLQNAIAEAISNVINHAYDENAQYKKWFLFFCIDKEKNTCLIVVSDVGKTIPVTIPVKLRDRLSINPIELFTGKNDSQLIEIATKWRRSATEEYHRGKGFNDIMQVESDVDGANVIVLSRKGAWSSVAGLKDYKDAIEGTTVGWEIPLNNVELVASKTYA